MAAEQLEIPALGARLRELSCRGCDGAMVGWLVGCWLVLMTLLCPALPHNKKATEIVRSSMAREQERTQGGIKEPNHLSSYTAP